MTQVPTQIQTTLDKLKSEKFIQEISQKFKIYLVGGSVRDGFLHKQPKDIDIVIEGTTIETLLPLLSPFGKLSVVGQSFQVIKFKPFSWEDDIDIAMPRIDKKISLGHKGFEIISDPSITIEQDLSRRDITINSIAISIDGKIIDPFKGLEDLSRGVIRATSTTSFIEDPLRMLRVIGFASRFKFEVDSTTLALMKKHSSSISEIAGERIKEEFDKIITKHGDISIMLKLLSTSELDKHIFGKPIEKTSLTIEIGELDSLSFYYLLGSLSDKLPFIFYKEVLKGEYRETKELEILGKLLTAEKTYLSDDRLDLLVLRVSTAFPRVLKTQLFGEKIKCILDCMDNGIIPSKISDILITGEDVLKAMGEDAKGGKIVGDVIDEVYKGALDCIFKWKDREVTLEYMKFCLKQLKK